jgi:hypothetical protein
MVASRVEPGRERGPADGSRRFTPIDFHFDTGANVLAQTVADDWEPQIKEQWLPNQALVREGLVHQFGAVGEPCGAFAARLTWRESRMFGMTRGGVDARRQRQATPAIQGTCRLTTLGAL